MLRMQRRGSLWHLWLRLNRLHQWKTHAEQQRRRRRWLAQLTDAELAIARHCPHTSLRHAAIAEQQRRLEQLVRTTTDEWQGNSMDIIEQLKRDEGFRQFPYRDTRDIETIGYGFNLQSDGLTPEESEYVLRCRISRARVNIVTTLPWAMQLDDVRMGVLINMAYNMGLAGLLEFKTMLNLVQRGDYLLGSQAMLQSKWAAEVGERAKRLALQMKTGQWQ